jgi:hypothetical protein
MEKIRTRGLVIRDKHPGSATLSQSVPARIYLPICLRIVNGRKVTTKKVMENGVETVTTYEDDVMKSRTVNGVPQQMQQQVSYLNSYSTVVHRVLTPPPRPL